MCALPRLLSQVSVCCSVSCFACTAEPEPPRLPDFGTTRMKDSEVWTADPTVSHATSHLPLVWGLLLFHSFHILFFHSQVGKATFGAQFPADKNIGNRMGVIPSFTWSFTPLGRCSNSEAADRISVVGHCYTEQHFDGSGMARMISRQLRCIESFLIATR